jgi:hypothetical protein
MPKVTIRPGDLSTSAAASRTAAWYFSAGQLLSNRINQPAIGDYHPPFGRHQIAEPIDSLTDHRLAAHQFEQLFRRIVPAGGPKASAGAAGHDDRVKHVGD